jgi:hypothetical protein
VTRRRRPLALLAALLLAAGCRSATDTGAPPVNLEGQWRYAAEQTAPQRTVIDGTLTIDWQGGHQLDGSLAAHETSISGTRALSGFVNGRVPDAATIEFQVDIGAGTRLHQGRIAGDSIVGTWFDEFSGGGTGTFRCAR